MELISVEIAWRLGQDKRDRYLAAADRHRRLRPRPPVDRLPDPPDRAA